MNDIAALAKQTNDVYLAAYRTGYEAGWTVALKLAVQIIEGPTAAPSSEIPTIDVPEIYPRQG
jgi:hypothetical protein